MSGEKRKKIPVVFAVNDNYLKYTSITIASILDHRRYDEDYIFYVLHQDITVLHQKMLEKWLESLNTTVKFVNVANRVDSRLLYISGYVTEETYYRILIPELFPELEKAIYMDCDIVCLSNLGDIMDAVDFKDNDIWLSGTLASRNENRNTYCQEHLGIPSETYIFAGMLVLNIPRLCEVKFEKKCFDFLKEKKWLKQHDMDLINAVCFGHIQVLEQHWHTTVGAIAYSREKNVEQLKIDDLQCCMLHYATLKPWTSELIEVMLPYWRYVYKSPFASEIVEAYRIVSDTKKHFSDMCVRNEIAISFLLRLVLETVKSKMKKWRKQ